MQLSPSNLIYHELIGLACKVIDATNSCLVNIRGKVVDETRNMIVVETDEMCEKMVPKHGTIFVFQIPSRTSGKNQIIQHIQVNGNLLLSQPANRTKNIRKVHMR